MAPKQDYTNIYVEKQALADACQKYIDGVDEYRKNQIEKWCQYYMVPRKGWFGRVKKPLANNMDEAMKVLKDPKMDAFDRSRYTRIMDWYSIAYNNTKALLHASQNEKVFAIYISLETYSYLFAE